MELGGGSSGVTARMIEAVPRFQSAKIWFMVVLVSGWFVSSVVGAPHGLQPCTPFRDVYLGSILQLPP